MPLSASSKKTAPAIYFLIIVLPFLIFYWMAPFITDRSIGQDYQQTTIQNQMELLFSIKTGSFPLYIPGYAMGNSSSTLTLGQVFHPLAHLASIMPGYWAGKALQWNTLLRLLSLGLSHLILFLFLRKLRIKTLFSFLISFITVYNLRMLDLFRYGASLEAYTAFIMLCAVIGLYYIDRTRRYAPLSIIGLTYLLVCSGHTQMMYYGLFGTLLFSLVAPSLISSILADKDFDLRVSLNLWGRTAVYLSLGVLLSSAYLFPFYFDFVASNVDRVGQSYAWADGYRDTFVGTLNNFFLPFRSDVHGAFGGSSLFIIAAIVPLLRCYKIKVPYSIWIIWGMFLLFFMYMQGARIPVHYMAWKYMPFVSSFRIAGRISLIIPVFIMLLLAWIAQAKSFQISLRGSSYTLTPASLLAFMALISMGAYFLVVATSIFLSSSIMLDFAHFTPVTIRDIPRSIEVIVILSGAASIIALALYAAYPRVSYTLGIILCLMVLIQTGVVLKYGTWTATRHDKPTFEQMLADKKVTIEYPYSAGSGYYSSAVKTQVRRSFIEPFLGKIYTIITPVSNMDESYNMMKHSRVPQQLFVENYEPGKSPSISDPATYSEKGNVELIYSSFNNLKFRVFSSRPAFLGISYPFTGHWNAWINGQKTRIYRANGAAHAVQIPDGENLIEVRYWSNSAFWGMIVSCTTFVLIGLYVCISSSYGIRRVISVIIVLILGTGGFFLWYNSLYSGDNLGTTYSWTYSPPSSSPNLAYGKQSSVSLSLPDSYLRLHSSRAVDGDRSWESGFMTAIHDNPSWTVDLDQATMITKIILYESRDEELLNTRPLIIDLSLDGRQWFKAASLMSLPDKTSPLHVALESPKAARYIRITASGNCMLAFDEVEVY